MTRKTILAAVFLVVAASNAMADYVWVPGRWTPPRWSPPRWTPGHWVYRRPPPPPYPYPYPYPEPPYPGPIERPPEPPEYCWPVYRYGEYEGMRCRMEDS
jgi:hypothetical protein